MAIVECQSCGALQPNIPEGTVIKMCFDCVKEVLEEPKSVRKTKVAKT